MIILITGASHTGKTLLAQQLLERFSYPYLSIDHLKMGLIRSGNTRLTPEDDDALTAYLWPIVREWIKTAVENDQNLIVEGCLLSIRFVCLAMTDGFIDNHFDEIKLHASDIEARLDDAECTVANLKADNRQVVEGFQKAGERVAFIDADYEETIRTVL